MSKSRDIPLSLIAQLDDEEIAKGIFANGLVDGSKGAEEQRTSLYHLLSQQKRAIYLRTSHNYAENTQYCVERGNKQWGIEGISANQLFLYDLVLGTLSIGTLAQLITLLQYYTYFTDPTLLASFFKNKNKGSGSKPKRAQVKDGDETQSNHDMTLDEMVAAINLDPTSTKPAQHSQFYSIQLSVLDVLLSLAKHSTTAASIVACTDGLLTLLSKFASVPSLLAITNTKNDFGSRLVLERRLTITIQLLLQCANSHPIILSEIDHHVSGSIISYLTLVTSNLNTESNQYQIGTGTTAGAGPGSGMMGSGFTQILDKLNTFNPILWYINSLYNGASTVLPLSLFDFNSNNIYILYRSLNALLAAALDL
jgi:hypothetical protein